MVTTQRGRAIGGVAIIAVTLALVGCSTDLVVTGSSVTVAATQPFTSFNDKTGFGSTAANTSIVAATNSGFVYYDDTPELVRDTSFGTVEVVSDEPFAVRYTVNDGITWSDGVAIDSADLLLAWAANSGSLSTPDFDPGDYVDPETGQFTEFPDDTVYFDGARNSGLQFLSKGPVLGEDGRSITLEYDEYFADWELAFDVGLPAHVVVDEAIDVSPVDDETEADAAKRTLIDAIVDDDASQLAPIAAAWNSAFNLGSGAVDTSLFVGSGPYSITAVVPNESVTLTANPNYRGDREPHYETVTVTTIADPLVAVEALADGAVDVIEPAPSIDVMAALARLDEATVVSGSSGLFEHLDLQFSGGRSGAFDDLLVREAFLLTVPRSTIVDELVAPLQPDAAVRDSLVIAPGRDGYDETVVANGSEAFSKPDIAEAKRLLEEAGAASPTVCILFDPANPRRVEEFTLIADSAARAGFVVTNCSQANWEEFLGVNGEYDAALFAWNETTDAVTGSAARLATDSTISNFSHYASDTVDDLLAELAIETERSNQLDLLAEVDAELFDDGYGLPLYQYPLVTAYRSSIRNIAPSPLEPGLLWNVWDWEPVESSG